MKRFIKIIIVWICIFTLGLNNVYAKSIKLNVSNKVIYKNSSFTLKVKNTKKKASVTYPRKSLKVKRLSKRSFKVTGISKGTYSVKVKVGKKRSTCKVTVNEWVSLKIIGVGKTMFDRKVTYSDGTTGYSVLKKTGYSLKVNGFGKYIYVRSINGLKEKAYGPRSGWMYSVNGVYPNKSAGAYKLSSGDKVVWKYVNYK